MYLPPGARAECDGNRADGVFCRRRAVQCQILLPVIFRAVGSTYCTINAVEPRSSDICKHRWLRLVSWPSSPRDRWMRVWRRLWRKPANKPDNLGPIVVSPPQRKPVRRADPGTQRIQIPARVAGRPRPQTAVVAPATPDGRRAIQTPLDTNVVTEVGSRLGLTARQTPATVEVIDKQVIEDRGLRTTTDVAKAATGVIGGYAPGAPAIFSSPATRSTRFTTTSGSAPRP